MAFYLQFILVYCLIIIIMGHAEKMNLIYEWKYIDYMWNSPEAKNEAIKSGNYNFTSPILIDVDRSKDGRTFVTIVRTKGVPASLGVVSNQKGPGGPLLKPYPDWSWYKKGDCNSITNVFRIAIDRCNRLWVLDNGVIEEEQVCPAQLLTFNLTTNNLIHRVKIEDRISQNSQTHHGLLITPIVQTDGEHCEKSKVFIADVTGYGMIIVNLPYMWRLDGPYFAPEPFPHLSVSTIAGETFTLSDGLFGMALSPDIGNNPQFLIFRPFASRSFYAAKVNDIMQTKVDQPLVYYNFTNVIPSQSTAQAFSSEGTLFFGLTSQIAIACWNQFRDMTPQNIEIIAQDDETLQFASGVKVIPPSVRQMEEELWVVTNRYQKIALGTMNFNEINYRILKQSVRKLIAGTKCEHPGKFKRHYNHRQRRHHHHDYHYDNNYPYGNNYHHGNNYPYGNNYHHGNNYPYGNNYHHGNNYPYGNNYYHGNNYPYGNNYYYDNNYPYGNNYHHDNNYHHGNNHHYDNNYHHGYNNHHDHHY
ncbi:major royal jelly protein 1-like isoform X1 [Leptopilina boulardi]|uniref:major royal jelly protein 1-like isoform X1 n=1 Tax=Leptopilina boulardi TaxID=63433 RepID=UPI0021F60BE0|nr:major royal jelly protein 1-like isoform X1 [Leptopilina boulardi]